jgi:hypothetical protein
MNRFEVRPQQDGAQVWRNTDDATGETIRYRFVPAVSVRAGDRIEIMRQFTSERGVKRNENGRVLTGPESTALIALGAGYFVRVRELPVEEQD